jgi:VWFA-related protein
LQDWIINLEVNMRVPFRLLAGLLCCLSVCLSVSGFSVSGSPAPQASAAQAPQQGASPQAAPPADNANSPARSAGRRVSLDVVVTDKSGKAVSGLQQQDFTLLDDKQPQPILTFHETDEPAADPPMQAILLVDAVNNGFQGVSLQRQQLEKFLRQDDGRLPMPMSLLFLADTSTQLQPVPTSDGKALADALNSSQHGLRIDGRSQGFYGAVDRIQISLRTLHQLIAYEATQPGRKLLIWLSAGWPLLSGPEVQLSAKDQDFLFNNIVELSGALRQARITLYSVDSLGVSGTVRNFYYESFLKGVTAANKTQNGNLGLQVLAIQSGGQVLTGSNDVTSSIVSCMADAKAFYTISFDSPPADHPNEYHSLQVKIGKSGLTARTRTGYYAQR